MKVIKEFQITKDFLSANPDTVFVFGDNLYRVGNGGAALLRDHKQSYGFITKQSPFSNDNSFYTISEYKKIFAIEVWKLRELIKLNPDKIFLITKLGAGIANKFKIWENIIKPSLPRHLSEFKNVYLLWE